MSHNGFDESRMYNNLLGVDPSKILGAQGTEGMLKEYMKVKSISKMAEAYLRLHNLYFDLWVKTGSFDGNDDERFQEARKEIEKAKKLTRSNILRTCIKEDDLNYVEVINLIHEQEKHCKSNLAAGRISMLKSRLQYYTAEPETLFIDTVM